MDMIVPLLDKGADARLSLHRLCAASWLDRVGLPMIDGPLELSIDINDRDSNGCTAMHYLVRHLNQPDVAHHPISWGEDIDFANHVKGTPLQEVIKRTMLRQYNRTRKSDSAQLCSALLRAQEQWIRVLVEAEGSVEQPNASGQIPAQLLSELTTEDQRRRQTAVRETYGVQEA
ncbi:uncharacterized protein BO88DRAFT_418871 [Aspergillus vadensis CBS 113365]|uniref:Uncharacterized protein n=1 Tax=Aspergillus vadensis (strain CBS 113365 / IMI 142717 / IBT 24658) TaxID=1448311 RepID=A0A319AXH7_ASPVC|nr:hypothetical protein BO88DRAFT_418871 [Aspergillus vadensis CBS 113365]PYH64959.1 hypothetical protein BO88DRAFT_418871 [Aspergillus vadensis CBS 113365]